MKHVESDVHQAGATVVWTDAETGEVSRARSVPTPAVLEHLQGLGECLRVVMGGGLHSKFLGRPLVSCGAEVSVLDARKVAALMPAHKTSKTDRLDARALARVSSDNALATLRVWVADDHTEELRALTRTRE
jgi:transposase